MKNKKIYEVLVIGGGISACVFASKFINAESKRKIAIIEAGRGLGGRSSTRKSKKFCGWELNHGSPNFNICNKSNNESLKKFIDELLKNNFIKEDDSDSMQLISETDINLIKNSEFLLGHNYIPLSTMSELSKNIIKLNL